MVTGILKKGGSCRSFFWLIGKEATGRILREILSFKESFLVL